MSDKYQVGYGKPPKATQFKKGNSGNPQGRPKGTNNLKTDLTEELCEPIVIREGDRTMKVSKQRAMVKSVTAKAVKGDARAVNTLVSLILGLLGQEGLSGESSERAVSANEREVFAALMERAVADQDQSSGVDTDGEDEEHSDE